MFQTLKSSIVEVSGDTSNRLFEVLEEWQNAFIVQNVHKDNKS